jgi:hypothetical protein
MGEGDVGGGEVGVGDTGTEGEGSADPPTLAQLTDVAQRNDGRWASVAKVHLHHEVGATGQQMGVGQFTKRCESPV